MPTPAVAHLTRTFRAGAGIVISASHNPHYDNGFKFFGGNGEKLRDDIEEEIEEALKEPFATVDSAHLGRAYRVEDAAGRYVEFCKRTIPLPGIAGGPENRCGLRKRRDLLRRSGGISGTRR